MGNSRRNTLALFQNKNIYRTIIMGVFGLIKEVLMLVMCPGSKLFDSVIK